MVECQVCTLKYKVITQLHLKKHDLNLNSYLKKYAKAKIRDDYKCEYCKKMVINGRSSKSKYCSTVLCERCGLYFLKGINNDSKGNGHLQNKHKLTNKEYLNRYLKSKILSCSEQVNKDNVLYNVRIYNAKKKKYVQKAFREANFEYGIKVNDDSTLGETRIDANHSAWDYLPNSGYKVLGTISDKDLTINSNTGRLRGMEKLEYQKNKMKEK